MEIERTTPTELTILECLAAFRFLTAEQLMRLGTTKNAGHLYTTLRGLHGRRPRLVEKLDFGVLPKRGRLPVIYCLTPAGADRLARARREEPVVVPARYELFPHDYFHRINC